MVSIAEIVLKSWYRLKKSYFLIFTLITLYSWSQTRNSVVNKRIKYSSNDGYHILAPTTAVYDDLGWLWIVGNNAINDEYLFEKKDIIIQRFDGISFYDVKLPKFKDEIINAFLYYDKPNG